MEDKKRELTQEELEQVVGGRRLGHVTRPAKPGGTVDPDPVPPKPTVTMVSAQLMGEDPRPIH